MTQTSAVIKQLIRTVPISFRRSMGLMTDLMAESLIPSAFNTDWSMEYGNVSNDYLVRNVPRQFKNSTCYCVVSSSCQEPLLIGPPDLILPGLVIGCLPIHGMRMSTLECFYSSNCIDIIISYLGYYTSIDGSLPVNFTIPEKLALQIPPLNSSFLSRFSPSTSIGTIMDELFVEQWTNMTTYEAYFAACAPRFCRFEYTKQKNAILVISTLLSLYGGLTTSLRLLTWNAVRLYHHARLPSRSRHTRVAPQSNNRLI